jgi:hypothetical protein
MIFTMLKSSQTWASFLIKKVAQNKQSSDRRKLVRFGHPG